MKTLTRKQIDWLNSFNTNLKIIEMQAHAEMRALERQLTQRVENPNDPLNDFEIEAAVHFALHESDPEFSEDSDNFIIEDRNFSLPDNYNEVTDCAEHDRNFGVENHCHLFYTIFSDLHVSLWDILRIGHVWVDIKPNHQYIYDFQPTDEIQTGMATCTHCQKHSSFVFTCKSCGDARCMYCNGKNNSVESTPLNYQQKLCFYCREKHSVIKIDDPFKRYHRRKPSST